MKVDDVAVQNYFLAPKAGNKADNTEGSFSNMLAEKVSEAENTTATPQASNIVTVPAEAARTPEPSLIEGVEGVVQLLDQYTNALGDPNTTLKEIEPLAEQLEAQAAKLSELVGDKPQNSLEKLAMNAMTQAQVEAYKFHRGDYI